MINLRKRVLGTGSTQLFTKLSTSCPSRIQSRDDRRRYIGTERFNLFNLMETLLLLVPIDGMMGNSRMFRAGVGNIRLKAEQNLRHNSCYLKCKAFVLQREYLCDERTSARIRSNAWLCTHHPADRSLSVIFAKSFRESFERINQTRDCRRSFPFVRRSSA